MRLLTFILAFAYLTVNGQSKELFINLEIPQFLLDSGKANRNNIDNVIYKGGKVFFYKYYFLKNKRRKKVFLNPYKIENGTLSSLILNRNDAKNRDSLLRIDSFRLYVFQNLNGEKSLDQDQTIIKYEYFNKKNRVFYAERTTVLENGQTFFMHPPRSHQFSFTEYFPFLFIEKPLKKGNELIKEFSFDPESYSYKPKNEELSQNFVVANLNYIVSGRSLVLFKNTQPIWVWKINAILKNDNLKTTSSYYFSEKYGIIKAKLRTLDGYELKYKLTKITNDWND